MSFKTVVNKCENYSSCIKDNELPAVDNFNSIYHEDKYKEYIFDPKVIIVGTFTPYDGRQNGFFYSSNNNHQMKFIDEDLGKLKQGLVADHKNEQIIKKILDKLKNLKIMFLDTVYCNYDANQRSAKDDLIVFDTLDDVPFEPYIKNDIRFICNSHNAVSAFLKICEKFNSYPKEIIYVPQINYRTKDKEKKRQWKYAIDLKNQKFDVDRIKGYEIKRVP